MRTFYKVLGVLIVPAIVIGIAVGGYYIKRKVNAALYYDSATEEIVCKMVKKEHLTDYGVEVCKD